MDTCCILKYCTVPVVVVVVVVHVVQMFYVLLVIYLRFACAGFAGMRENGEVNVVCIFCNCYCYCYLLVHIQMYVCVPHTTDYRLLQVQVQYCSTHTYIHSYPGTHTFLGGVLIH